MMTWFKYAILATVGKGFMFALEDTPFWPAPLILMMGIIILWAYRDLSRWWQVRKKSRGIE